MYQVLGLRRLQNTDPQEFEILFKDKANTKMGYVITTDHGTEPELRSRLKEGGILGPDIEKLFGSAS